MPFVDPVLSINVNNYEFMFHLKPMNLPGIPGIINMRSSKFLWRSSICFVATACTKDEGRNTMKKVVDGKL
jgi:hypothetical protein